MRLSYSKFGNQILGEKGSTFRSKKEFERWEELLFLQDQKLITDLDRNVRFDLIVNGVEIGTYTADFVYKDPATGKTIIDDAKGYKTQHWKRTKKLLNAIYPEYEVVES